MRKKIVAGNWKMHKTLEEGIALTNEVIAAIGQQHKGNHPQVILCPPFIHLKTIADLLANFNHTALNIQLGSQNCHWENQGAFTGEVSVSMLKSVGVQYVIIGHSERRQLFSESNEMLAGKVNSVLQNGLTPVFCCGEMADDRKKGKQFEVVIQQLAEGIFHLPKKEIESMVIAYEPVWAIGTGVNATPEQAGEMHGFIRSSLAKQYNEQVSENISILYGGSCKPDNAKEIFSQKNVDGGLIGGASLKAADFTAIINSF